MLVSFDPGTDLAGAAEHCSCSISVGEVAVVVVVVAEGAAHTAQAADGLTRSQPAAAPQCPRKLGGCETKGVLTCAHHENKSNI